MSDYISFRHHTYEQPTGVKSIELKVQRLLVNLFVMLVMMAQRRCSGPPHAITAAHLAGAVHACLAVTLTRTLSIAGARPALRVQAVPDQAGDHGPAARGQRVRAARLHPQRQEGPAGGGGGGGPAVTNQCGRYMMGCWQPFDASRRTVLPDALGLHFGGDSAFAENELRVRSDGPPVVVLRSPRQYRDAQRSSDFDGLSQSIDGGADHRCPFQLPLSSTKRRVLPYELQLATGTLWTLADVQRVPLAWISGLTAPNRHHPPHALCELSANLGGAIRVCQLNNTILPGTAST